jgi:hypothetical protein
MEKQKGRYKYRPFYSINCWLLSDLLSAMTIRLEVSAAEQNVKNPYYRGECSVAGIICPFE